jgi:ectoine hydroxylase-related dioxygenase (phytanoyl-CoA dioxygenase family)
MHNHKSSIIEMNNDDVDDHESINSADALRELLGIDSLDLCCDVLDDEDETDHHPCTIPIKCQSIDEILEVSDKYIIDCIEKYQTKVEYANTSVCIFPSELSLPSAIMRRLTDELVWGGDKIPAIDRTFENVKYLKDGIIHDRSTLTRFENLTHHSGWLKLCNHYIKKCISTLFNEEMVLYKTKMNLKPAGGSGFAPHVDTPSLTVPFSNSTSKLGPLNFVTVMIAIDDMTSVNGCLRVVKGIHNEDTCPIIPPEEDANPDSGGRAGAIPIEIASKMKFEDICCKAGTICAFGGWVPHRSNANQSNFSRRAVFLTYNPAIEGDYYDLYYQKMKQIRNSWKATVGLRSIISTKTSSSTFQIDETEIDALSTIPRI